MARPPRLDLPGVPQHVVIRGNNRTDLFRDDNDRNCFVRYLRQAARDTEIHAFVLMTNHVHLLATGEVEGALSRLAQSVGRRYARYVNRVHQRTGTLFEGRFRASLVDSERYLFTCMRYIELNPVRAGIVASPGEYAWSSFRQNAGLEPFGWLVPRMEYRALGKDAPSCAKAYLALFAAVLSDQQLQEIRDGIRKGSPLGSAAFLDHIENVLQRPVLAGPRGRPRREKVI